MQISERYCFFSGLSGTTAIFRPEGNIPFFSTAPAKKHLLKDYFLIDLWEKYAAY